MTSAEYAVCETQGRFFSCAAEKGCVFDVFTDVFMTSDFCLRLFDSPYSRLQMEDEDTVWFEFSNGPGAELPLYENGEAFDPDTAGWIGFTYRQLCFETGILSSKLNEQLPFDAMLRLYPAYHTLDEETAARRIIESFSLPVRRRRPEHAL